MKQCSVLNSSALELENRYKEDSIPKVVYIFAISKTKYRLLFLEMLTKFSFTAAGEIVLSFCFWYLHIATNTAD